MELLGGILLVCLSTALILSGNASYVTAGVSGIAVAVIYIGSRIFQGETE